ncbi:hypothetical protein VXS03_06960 [Photobacterium sp. S4TG1]|jgi:hypothetical protein|uniref:hypothetical protein n=1 Tax=Photobacterium TaxID=657 RepID=UPI001E2FABDB|nr:MULTISPECIES: hypothetical protein [Photobacterium]MCD9525516.1 hypothetical protein [Photobacterium carnosum]MEC6796781.1 hypothetical protein [Photobacterium sp. S4TG1]
MTIENETGRIIEIIDKCGNVVCVMLTNGAVIDIATTHEVKVGDWVVEGELSQELASK